MLQLVHREQAVLVHLLELLQLDARAPRTPPLPRLVARRRSLGAWHLPISCRTRDA
jgi:hypothetical protein